MIVPEVTRLDILTELINRVRARQGGHKPALAEFRRWGVGESTDEMIDDKQRL
jgi:hypothetical protein